MTDLDRLLAAILANPTDDATRLVYADKVQDLDTEEARARAEFIRVQCEIADQYAGKYEASESNDRRQDWLQRRERELWQIVKDQFVGPGYDVWLHDTVGDSDVPHAYVRRGFVAELRAPLASLVGGRPCPKVEANGGWTGDDGRFVRDYRTCSKCYGTGSTHGVLSAIAQAHPLEWVGATDAIHEDGRFPGGHRIDREQFPRELWLDLISRVGGIDANVITGTREGLEELLSRALIAWARKEQPCTT